MMKRPPFPKSLPAGVAWTWSVRDAAWARIYHQDYYTDSPLRFRAWGPQARFDHHTAPPNKPAVSANRSVIYLGESIQAVAAEVFGDLPSFRVCPQWRLGWVRPVRSVAVQDIVGAAAMKLGTHESLGSAPLPRRFTQDCARRIYGQHRHLAGIRYRGRHEGSRCLALWERAAPLMVVEDDGVACDSPVQSQEVWESLLLQYVEPTGHLLEQIDSPQCSYCRRAAAAAGASGA